MRKTLIGVALTAAVLTAWRARDAIKAAAGKARGLAAAFRAENPWHPAADDGTGPKVTDEVPGKRIRQEEKA